MAATFRNADATNHVTITYTDGETINERHRDCRNGFDNMLARIATANGARRCTLVAYHQDATTGAETLTYTVNGRTFTIANA